MYGLLHYRGDVTHLAVPGRVLGQSAAMIPFEVTEAEYQPDVDTTTVFLQNASPETMRNLMALRESLQSQIAAGAVPPAGYTPRRNGKSRSRR